MSGHQKLRGPARQLIASLAPSGSVDPSSEVAVLVRGRTPFTPEQLAVLESGGVRVRSVAGDVLSADLAAEALTRLAEQDFVVAIELSQPLFPETPSPAPGGFADVE